jgi:hypothetical protein
MMSKTQPMQPCGSKLGSSRDLARCIITLEIAPEDEYRFARLGHPKHLLFKFCILRLGKHLHSSRVVLRKSIIQV